MNTTTINRKAVEALIDRYISENALVEGSSLPPDDELAIKLQCDMEAVSGALRAAEKKGKVKREANGQVIVLSLPVLRDQEDNFSFTKSAHAHGEALTTEVIEKGLRLPTENEEDKLFSNLEKKAHSALGLHAQAPFIVIARLRRLDGEPRALHRAYLDPKRFPQDFLAKHDFATESLIHIYNQYGYELTCRDTVLTARIPSPRERAALNVHLNDPLLEAEQKLFALDPKTGKSFVLEFLQASYLNWHYEVKNRRAPRSRL